MAEDQKQPIIIKRKKHGGHGHHGGAWKVAFADFMTAMMAFFLVLWLVGQKDEVKQAVAGYFRDPGKFQQEGKAGVLKGGASAIPSDAPKNEIAPVKDEDSGGPPQKEKAELTMTAKRILKEFEKQAVFRKLKKNVKINLTSEGLRITLNESEDGAAFFEPGSDKLLRRSAVLLMIIAKELGKLSNQLVIEGHTDATQSDGDFSNWELSASRANSARRLMEVSGLREKQVNEVRGVADRALMIRNDPSDPRNRRVSIIVLYKNRSHSYDQMDVGEDLVAEFSG